MLSPSGRMWLKLPCREDLRFVFYLNPKHEQIGHTCSKTRARSYLSQCKTLLDPSRIKVLNIACTFLEYLPLNETDGDKLILDLSSLTDLQPERFADPPTFNRGIHSLIAAWKTQGRYHCAFSCGTFFSMWKSGLWFSLFLSISTSLMLSSDCCSS